VAAASAQPAVAAAATAPTDGTPATAAAATQLPFTGPDIRPFLLIGFPMVILGLLLIMRSRPGEHSRRRYRH
jgi:hypothetical protein